MKTLSAFDVVGPNMIGPSSSHTAGALRISLLARNLMPSPIRAAHFVLYGSFASTYKGHGTDRALVGGVLGYQPDDFRIKESLQIAKEQGLDISFEPNFDEKELHPNTVDVHLTGADGEEVWVRGVSLGGGRAELRGIDGVEIQLTGEYSTIFIKQQDTPGVVAHIAGTLSENKINIAFMRLYREAKGAFAYTVIEADEKISPDVLKGLEAHASIHRALLIQ